MSLAAPATGRIATSLPHSASPSMRLLLYAVRPSSSMGWMSLRTFPGNLVMFVWLLRGWLDCRFACACSSLQNRFAFCAVDGFPCPVCVPLQRFLAIGLAFRRPLRRRVRGSTALPQTSLTHSWCRVCPVWSDQPDNHSCEEQVTEQVLGAALR